MISVFCLKHRPFREAQDSAAWGMWLCPGHLSKLISPWPQHSWHGNMYTLAFQVLIEAFPHGLCLVIADSSSRSSSLLER